jgi:uncharacterized membrane protein
VKTRAPGCRGARRFPRGIDPSSPVRAKLGRAWRATLSPSRHPSTHAPKKKSTHNSGPSYNYYAAPPLVGGYGGFAPWGFSPFGYGGYGFAGPGLVVGGGGGLFFNLIFFGMVASFVLSAFRGAGSNSKRSEEDDDEDDGWM